MPILRAWVASHTGLPCFYVTGNGELRADIARSGIVVGSRLVVRVAGEALVSDPGAPAGLPVKYRFGTESVVLTRAAGVGGLEMPHQWITSIDGDTVADVRLTGSDERETDTGGVVYTSALGRHIPRFPLGQEPASGTLEFLTSGAGTERIREFQRYGTPLWVVHNAVACQIPDCDLEASRLVVFRQVRERRTGRVDKAERAWSVSYTRVPDSVAAPVGAERESAGPVVTWGQWESWGEAHAPAGWQNWSAVEVARRVAGMPV